MVDGDKMVARVGGRDEHMRLIGIDTSSRHEQHLGHVAVEGPQTILLPRSPEDLVESHRLLCEKQVNVAPLVTHHVPLEKLRESIDWILAQKAMKVIVNP